MKIVDFRTSAYFSLPFLLFAGALSFFGLIALMEGLWWVALLLWLASLLIFTTHYRVTINFSDKTFHDYLWIVGMKTGEKGTFDAMAYVFVKKSKVSQTMHARVASTRIEKEAYDGYLKFSNGATIHLATKDSREKLLPKLHRMAHLLELTLIDHTQEEAKVS